MVRFCIIMTSNSNKMKPFEVSSQKKGMLKICQHFML